MTVFVAEACFDYEGCESIGVFSTLELAQKACDENKSGDFYNVTAWDVDAGEGKTVAEYRNKQWRLM